MAALTEKKNVDITELLNPVSYFALSCNPKRNPYFCGAGCADGHHLWVTFFYLRFRSLCVDERVGNIRVSPRAQRRKPGHYAIMKLLDHIIFLICIGNCVIVPTLQNQVEEVSTGKLSTFPNHFSIAHLVFFVVTQARFHSFSNQS